MTGHTTGHMTLCRSVVIDKCSHCLVVLGGVERSVVINNSNSLCVVAACRRIHVRLVQAITNEVFVGSLFGGLILQLMSFWGILPFSMPQIK